MSISQYKKDLSLLSIAELLQHLDERNKLLFKPLNPVGVLPWSHSDLPSFESAKKVLDHYYPVKCSEYTLVTQVKTLMQMIEMCQKSEQKAYIVRHLFRLLTVNVWFMEKHENFRLTTQDKLCEFKVGENKRGREIAHEFSWMLRL